MSSVPWCPTSAQESLQPGNSPNKSKSHHGVGPVISINTNFILNLSYRPLTIYMLEPHKTLYFMFSTARCLQCVSSRNKILFLFWANLFTKRTPCRVYQYNQWCTLKIYQQAFIILLTDKGCSDISHCMVNVNVSHRCGTGQADALLKWKPVTLANF